MRNKEIRTFYKPEMVPSVQVMTDSFSKSPLKPKLLLEHVDRVTKGWPELWISKDESKKLLLIDSEWKPFDKEDFLVAHKEEYVNDFLNGIQPMASSNQMPWSEELVRCVKHTNSSLYHAIKYSNEHPETVCFSPTSGFHHASPDSGLGFCTFSGQVIASTKLYREKGLVGAYLDLDGHMGNSIEDSRKFVPDLNKSIPKGFNINIFKNDQEYVKELARQLEILGNAIMENKVHYVVFCHGADSHEWDDTTGPCHTSAWLQCSDVFYEWVEKMDVKLGRPLPVTLALFGGYRQDRYESVLDLHVWDLLRCAKILCGLKIDMGYMNWPKFIESENLEAMMDRDYAQGDFNFMPNKLANPMAAWDANKYTSDGR
jgi:acetoin utilization deacetylase AcuC-like enzyme